VTAGRPGERLRRAASTIAAKGSLGRLVGVGWATVELDRAAVELAADLGGDAAAFVAAPGSAVLAASCRVASGLLPDGVAVVILEPTAEGRLAGWLARHDEGPVAAWLEESSVPTAEPRPEGTGPFGPERPAPPGDDGLVRFLVTRPAGTIRP
jgi:hypothetical protein